MIQTLVFILLISQLHRSWAVTSRDPCDPIRNNVTTTRLFHREEMKILMDLNVTSSWLVDPLRYVNCSKRGLTRVPPSIASSVEILDLSSNLITQVKSEDFKQLSQLKVLWLYSNCLGSTSTLHSYCKERGTFDKTAFSFIFNLKVLNIGGNTISSFPESLPVSLQYLDISRTSIQRISKSDIGYLTNLTALIAYSLYREQGGNLVIDPESFTGIPIKLLNLRENKKTIKAVSRMRKENELLYVNLAKTGVFKLTSKTFENVTSVKRLDMYVQHVNAKKYVIVEKGVFDQLTLLEHLDLSCNLIDFLPEGIFQHNQHLAYLDLSGNCLNSAVFDPTFVPSRLISSLHLGYNLCHSRAETSNNHSALYKLGPSFLNFTNLSVLSFGRPNRIVTDRLYSTSNNLRYLNNESLSVLQKLSSLRTFLLDNTYGEFLDLTAFSVIASLTYIDLKNNKIGNVTSSGLRSSHATVATKLNHNSTSVMHYHDANKPVCLTELHLTLSYNRIYRLRSAWFSYPALTNLDLSFNLISTIQDRAFKHMPCLREINLRYNPIQYLHPKAFDYLSLLSGLFIRSTSVIRSPKSLQFLHYFHHPVELQFNAMGSLLFQVFIYSTIHPSNITVVDLSHNHISSSYILNIGLKQFAYARKLTLAHCGINFFNFQVPIPRLLYLDLSGNTINEIRESTLKDVTNLVTLIMSDNKIKHLTLDLFVVMSQLNYLDVSNNLLQTISFNSSRSLLPNLKILQLRNNYLFRLSRDTFPLYFLQRLKLLDLRWNSFECSCEITKNFGVWLNKNTFFLHQRPGFLPGCQLVVSSSGFSDCVTCSVTNENQVIVEQPLLRYATQSQCISWFNVVLMFIFNGIFLLFIGSGIFANSSRSRLWFIRLASRNVFEKHHTSDDTQRPAMFAFHAMILFDTDDLKIGDWVDDQLLPNLTCPPTPFKVTVVGRDDQCGFSPVKQLLLKIEASWKVVLVLSGRYAQSYTGRYALSVLENLEYQTGSDRVVIVTIGSTPQAGGLIRKRRKNKPWTIVNFPDEEEDYPIFWENLRNALKWS